MRYYYADEQNKPAGPVTRETLETMRRDGKIADTTYVLPAGTRTWVTYAQAMSAPEGEPVGPEMPPPVPAQGATEARARAGKPARPLAILIFGWLTTIGAALGVLNVPFGIPGLPKLIALGGGGAWVATVIIANFVIQAVLDLWGLFAGIGLIGNRPWSRRSFVRRSVATIAVTLLLQTWMIPLFLKAIKADFAEQYRSMGQGDVPPMMEAVFIVTLVSTILGTLVYHGLAIYFLTRKEAVEAVEGVPAAGDTRGGDEAPGPSGL